MFLSKNRLFVCALLLSVTIYLMWAPTAQAGFVVDVVTGVFDSIVSFIEDHLLLVVVIAAIILAPEVMIPYSSVGGAVWTAPAGTKWILTLEQAAALTLGAGESLFTFNSIWYISSSVILAAVAAPIVACAEGLICSSGSTDTVLVTIKPTQYECDNPQQFEISTTFYIPSFDPGNDGVTRYCGAGCDRNNYNTWTPVPADAQRYAPESYERAEDENGRLYGPVYAVGELCHTSDAGGEFMKIGSNCYSVKSDVIFGSFGETKNKIALYRVSAPVSQFQTSGEMDKTELTKLFTGVYGNWGNNMGTSEHKFGDGLAYWSWGDDSPVIQRAEENLLAIYSYASNCSGNVCTLKDKYNAPENSYIFYAAKILGDYKWAVNQGPDSKCDPEGTKACSDIVVDVASPAKFLSNVNPPVSYDLATFPWIAADRYTLGDVLWGPVQTESLEACPVAQSSISVFVAKSGTGSGMVTSDIGGINCGSTCSASFTTATNKVTLTAVADSGSVFSGWGGTPCKSSGGDSNSGWCTIIDTSAYNFPTADINAEAVFTSQLKTLTITKSGGGSGTVRSGNYPTKVNCGSFPCSASFEAGLMPSLIVTPNAGSVFDRWSENVCVPGTGGTSAICMVSMTADKTVNVSFNQLPPGDFSLSLNGSVTCNSVPLSWTDSSGADNYAILREPPRVNVSPYQPYTAQNYTDTTPIWGTNYVYQIEAYNTGGVTRSSNTVRVSIPYCSPAIDLSVTQGFLSRIYQGQGTSLTWTSSFADSCTASAIPGQNDWSWQNSANVNSSQPVRPLVPSGATSVVYGLKCSGPGGEAVAIPVTINVDPWGLPGWKEIIPR